MSDVSSTSSFKLTAMAKSRSNRAPVDVRASAGSLTQRQYVPTAQTQLTFDQSSFANSRTSSGPSSQSSSVASTPKIGSRRVSLAKSGPAAAQSPRASKPTSGAATPVRSSSRSQSMVDLAITATKDSLPKSMSGTGVTVVKTLTEEMSAASIQPLQSAPSDRSSISMMKTASHTPSIPATIQEQAGAPQLQSRSQTEKTDRLVRTARPASAASSQSSISSRR